MNGNHVDLEAYYHDKIRLLNMLQTLERHYDRELELHRGRLDLGSKHREQLQTGLETAHQNIEDLEHDRTRHNNEIRLAFQVLKDYKELFTEILERLEALEAHKPHPCGTADDCDQPFLGNCDDCPHYHKLPDQIVHLLTTEEDES